MNTDRKKISVVSGCFNEADNIDEWYTRVIAVFDKLPQYNLEIILIDNASVDNTVDHLRALAAKDSRVKVILNARNFGHIRSPYHALLQSSGDGVVAMASDLQDPPELIPQFIAKWEAGAKVVAGVQEKSAESHVFSLVRRGYYALVARLADIQTIQHFTGFGMYDRRVVELCRSLDDPYPYFRGIVAELGLPTETVTFNKPARKRGITKNNFYVLYDIAMLGLTNHSKIPLRIATMLGFAMSSVSALVGVVYLVYKLLFWQQFPVGMAPVVIGLFFFASVQLFFIGVVGEYIGAIHTQVLKRPHVVERERINF